MSTFQSQNYLEVLTCLYLTKILQVKFDYSFSDSSSTGVPLAQGLRTLEGL